MISVSGQSFIPTGFKTVADTYDDHASIQNRVARDLLDIMPDSEQFENLLEIGCGTGLYTRLLAERYEDVDLYAVDFSIQMVKQARQKLSSFRINWFIADARNFTLNTQFAGLTSSSSIHWAQPLNKLFENLSAHLRSDGQFVFSIMLRDTLRELQSLRRRVAPNKSPRRSLPTASTVFKQLEASGFTPDQHYRQQYEQKYESARSFLRALNEQGVTGNQIAAPDRPLTPGELEQIISAYETEYSTDSEDVRATYDVLYISAVPA